MTISLKKQILLAGFLFSIVLVVSLFFNVQPTYACPNQSPIPICADSIGKKVKEGILTSLFNFVWAGGANTYVGTGYHRCPSDRGVLWEPPVCYIDPYGSSGAACPPAQPPSPQPPPPAPEPVSTCSEENFCVGNSLYNRSSSCTETLVTQCSYICSSGACVPPPEEDLCSPLYFCADADTLYYRDSQCTETFTQSCSNGCSQGTCATEQPPADLPLTVSLEVAPILIQAGSVVQVSWTSENADSCAVNGENGDSFSGTSGSETSSAILQPTLFTLSCSNDSESDDESKLVRIVPLWEEF